MSIIQDLIKQGYEMKGPIKIDTDDLTKMGITTESINDTPREDKTVVVESNGTSKRVSTMMFGYNKKGIKLKDGSFANADELLAAIEEAVKSQEQGTIIVTEKGRRLEGEELTELLETVKEVAGKVVIGSQSEKVTNQEAKTWGVAGAGSEKVHPKGVVFLGNGQVQLPSGEYVSVDELQAALSEYMIMVPKKKEEPVPIPDPEPEPIEPEPTEPEPDPVEPEPEPLPPTNPEIDQQTVMRVTRKYKNRASIWLAILSAVLALALMWGVTLKPVEAIERIETYAIEYQMEDKTLAEEDMQTIIDNVMRDMGMGEKVYVEDGMEFGVTSNPEETRTKTMGEEFDKENKHEGEYRITGFAIWHDGNIYEFLEDFNGDLASPTIGAFIDEMCEKHNLPKDEIDFMVHVGQNQDGTRLGWIDASELVNQDEITQETIDYIQENSDHFFGRVDNFEGSTITLSNGDTVSVYDANGNLLQPGDKVVGASGIEYTVNEFEMITNVEENTVVVGEQKQIKFDFTAPEIAISVAPLLAALAFGIANYKKNKKAQENPDFVSVRSQEEKERFVRDFKKAKEEYEKNSGFGKLMKRVFYRKEFDRMQEFTEEQTYELYEAIEKHANRDFVLGDKDKIVIKNGKIKIEYHDGGIMDITDIVMPDVKSIGAENEYLEEGMYDDEVRRRF